MLNKLDCLLAQLKILVVNEKKELSSEEVVSLSKKIDKIIVVEMRNRNNE